ncbi:MAG: glycosyltransferase family 4 protein [Dermatophilaceae bacterium]
MVIASRLFTPEVAAASSRLRALARGLVDAGCEVVVLTSRPRAPAGEFDDPEGVRVRRWPALRDENGNIRGYAEYLSFDLPLVLRLLVTRSPDLIICEPPPTTGMAVLAVSRLRGLPYAYYAADIASEAAASVGAPSWVMWLLRLTESRVLRGARHVLAVSDGVAERLTGFGVLDERVQVVGNGVDIKIFGLDAVVDDRGPQPPQVPYAVYAGTMSEWQGAGVFVRGFARVLDQLPEGSRLVFLGQGSDLPALRRLAEQVVPGRVDFVGVLPPQQAARWQRSARCALVSILPGIGYDFARPTKIYAATAGGTPVLFAGVGAGAAQVREARLGEAVDHDPVAVGAALVRALANPPSQADRIRLAEWTEKNASLARVGLAAADGVLTAVGLS